MNNPERSHHNTDGASLPYRTSRSEPDTTKSDNLARELDALKQKHEVLQQNYDGLFQHLPTVLVPSINELQEKFRKLEDEKTSRKRDWTKLQAELKLSPSDEELERAMGETGKRMHANQEKYERKIEGKRKRAELKPAFHLSQEEYREKLAEVGAQLSVSEFQFSWEKYCKDMTEVAERRKERRLKRYKSMGRLGPQQEENSEKNLQKVRDGMELEENGTSN